MLTIVKSPLVVQERGGSSLLIGFCGSRPNVDCTQQRLLHDGEELLEVHGAAAIPAGKEPG
jgi:hypothetical protein